MSEIRSDVPPVATPVADPPGVPRPPVSWAAAATIVLSLLLCEAAVENVWRASPIRWWIVTATLAGALVAAAGWRKLRWPWALGVTSIVGLSLVVFGSLRLGSAADPGFHVAWLALARVVALLATAAVGLSSFALMRLSFVRRRWYFAAATAALGLYAVVPLAIALVRGIPVGGTFRGEGLWSLPPYWLQGSYVAAELLIPAGLVVYVSLLVWSFVKRAPERRLGLGVSALSLLAVFFVLSVELSRAGLPHLARAAVDPVLARVDIAGAPTARRSDGGAGPAAAGPEGAESVGAVSSSTDPNQPVRYGAPAATTAGSEAASGVQAQPAAGATAPASAGGGAAKSVIWTDWTDGTTGIDGSAKGTLTIGTTTVNVDYAGEIAFIQTGTGKSHNGLRNNFYNPPGPYISGLVNNAPPPREMIALSKATEKTLTFDHAIDNLFFAVVSLNGNGYGFNQDFEIVSTGLGFYGNGTLAKQDLGNGQYRLIGTGEPHGVIRFTGSVWSITWTSLTSEYWNGFTVGTYGLATNGRTGWIQIASGLQRTRKPTKNLEIILDASGSMKLALGKKTRWATALDVLKDVIAKLPDDFNVGLRIYGHRQPSTSPNTCTDSELMLPIARLNRERVLAAANRVKPRGETPLVYSVLQTPADLKAAGAGTVILITDGEESCKGDPVVAAQQLKASGVEATLHIVGFTLTGRRVQAQLATLAEATGGRYYEAQSGEALARALLIAANEKFPYAIFDASGRQVAKGETGASPAELPPGDYKVVVSAADQELTAGPLTVATGSKVVVKVVLKGDRFALER